MKRIIVYTLVLGLLATPWPTLAHGGRAGGFGGGGGGGFSHAAATHATYHAPTFSRPSTPIHTAPMGGGARGFAYHPAAIGRPGGFGAPGLASRSIAGRNFVPVRNNFGGVGGYRGNYYGNWYHGNWQGHWGRPWGAWPVGWGGYWPGSSWGLGLGLGLGVGLGTVGLMAASSPYNWGYYNYSNPYWGGPVAGMPYIDYSQPMVGGQSMMAGQMAPGQQMPPGQQGAPTAGLAGDPNAPNQQAMGIFDGARNMFMQGNYQAALDQVNQALSYAPKDPVLNEFRGLCLFAVGNYQQAAAADYAVLSTGPGWDWTTMSSFYPGVDAYTQQLRALEAYSQQHPQAADARFLLAYHYLREGFNNEAIAELQAVAQLEPKDQLSAQLLRGLSTPANAPAGGQLAGGQIAGGQPAPGGQIPPNQFDPGNGPPGPSNAMLASQPIQGAAPAQAAAPVAPESLIGDWSASRPDGSTFNLQLTGQHQFTWKFAAGGKKQTLTGTYTLADNYLILKGSDQNSLVGQVTSEAGNRFNFRLAGNNPADPGLEFTR